MGGMLANLVRPETEQPQRIFPGHCPASLFLFKFPFIDSDSPWSLPLNLGTK